MVKQYLPKQYISNYYEHCNLVVFIIAWIHEQWFTKDLTKNNDNKKIGCHGKTICI